MLASNPVTDKFGEIFPQLENVLLCGAFTHDFAEGRSYWSAGVYRLLGLEPDSAPCEPELFLRYVAEEDREMFKGEIRKAREIKEPSSFEFSLIDAGGNFKRVHAVTLFRNLEKSSYEGFLRDVTENYHYKLELEKKVQQLNKSNDNLQEFVYIASHDLQEPLRKISTFSGRLQSRFEGQLGEEGNMYIERILRSTGNMQTLLEDLLSFSRLSFSDKPFEKVSLQGCLQQVLSDLEMKIEEAGARITSDPLPLIDGYPGQIKQLFSNLISNALKFRKPDEVPLISVSAYMGDNQGEDKHAARMVKIEVTDNGIGFEQEYAEKIFMIFQRLNGRSEYPGSGVGLSICKRIVENHNGTIYAISHPGAGSTFTVLLPVTQNQL